MSVTKDKARGTYYYVFMSDGKWYKGRGYPTKSEAAAAEKERRKRITSTTRLLSEALEEKTEDLRLHGHGQQAFKLEQVFRCRIMPHLKDKRVSDYEYSDFTQMIKDLKAAGQSDNSINYVMSSLHNIFQYSLHAGWCNYNPTSRFRKIQVRRKEKTYWTEDEYNRAIEQIPEDRYKMRLLVSILYWTGMRRSEARALRWDDWDPDAKTLRIDEHYVEDGGHKVLPGRKNSIGSMIVSIDDRLAGQVNAVHARDKKLYGYQDTYLICGMRHKTYSLTNLAKTLDKISGAAGVPRITPHGLRHSHVSWLFSNTSLTPQEIADRIGDTTQVVLQVYAHLYSNPQQKIVEIINQSHR